MDTKLIKRVALRFARTFIAGFLAYLALVGPTMIVQGWKDYSEFLPGLLWAAIAAGLVAVDKAFRDLNTPV